MSLKIVLNDQNGRFGNKLFQIAATIAIAEKNNMEPFTNVGVQNQFIFKNSLLSPSIEIPKKIYAQQQWNYYDINLSESVDLRGYYQSEKFFLNCKDKIQDLYSIKEELINSCLNKIPGIKDCCSIHVRRTDYTSPPNYFNLMPSNYYYEAIKHSSCKEFCLFTDDFKWCRDNLKIDNLKIISYTDYEEFILMSLCRENIICNSTFGWWAAYLNHNKEKKVIAPPYNKWFGINYSNLNNCDIYPENWVQINYDS